MERKYFNDPDNSREYRTKAMRILVDQIKEDRKKLDRIWESLVKGPMSGDDREEFLRLISWLMEEMDEYKELRGTGIEGVLWGDIGEIEKDIHDKERRLGLIQNPLYGKKEFTHLR